MSLGLMAFAVPQISWRCSFPGRRLETGTSLRVAATMNYSSPDSPGQERLVNQLKHHLATSHSYLPVGKNGRDDDELLLWFLQDRKFDVPKAGTKLANYIKWREEFGVNSITDDSIRKIASSGKAYLNSSPDVKGRPVLVVVAAKHFPREEEALASQKLCVHLVEKALQNLPPGGDQILGIFDLRGFNAANADLTFLKFLIDVFYSYYPRRLAEVLFVDAPFVFQPVWMLVKPLLKSYASLVRFCTADSVRRDYFTQDTVPLDFRK
ncbi:phosphatidylinositol transfer protein CSR1 [Selaginella moellendorffii]|nr:phosphatidylinositol transfer protein CSR1 [Selaginella moellendorffii]|eukprot:XP_002986250.2 phosphatidylinositol transfer protein CSR1 [Selaginella moellendorffii]